MFLVAALVVVLAVLGLALGAAWAGSDGPPTLSTMDGPARLLAFAVRGLPAARREWATAMTTELAHLTGRSERWRFASGCAGAALFPQRNRLPAALTGVIAIAASVVAGEAVGRVLPELRAFTIAGTALAGALAAVAVARARRPRADLLGLGTFIGVVACVGATAYVAATEPAGARGPLRGLAMVLAAVLTGYLWLVLMPPKLVGGRSARRIGTVAGLLLSADLALVSLVDYDFDHPVVPYGWAGVAALFLGCSALATAVDRSPRAGLVAALWAGLVSSLAFFSVESVAGLNRLLSRDPRVLDDFSGRGMPFQSFITGEVSERLTSMIVLLLLYPACGLLLALVGGAATTAVVTRRAGRPPRAEAELGGVAR